jgi:hypothetical protein
MYYPLTTYVPTYPHTCLGAVGGCGEQSAQRPASLSRDHKLLDSQTVELLGSCVIMNMIITSRIINDIYNEQSDEVYGYGILYSSEKIYKYARISCRSLILKSILHNTSNMCGASKEDIIQSR